MLALQTGLPQLAISDDEGAGFMKAAQNVLRHYSLDTTQKTLDWIAFAGVAGMIYGPRAVSIALDRRAARGPRRRTHDGKVIHLHEFDDQAGGQADQPPQDHGADVVDLYGAPEGFTEEGPSDLPN